MKYQIENKGSFWLVDFEPCSLEHAIIEEILQTVRQSAEQTGIYKLLFDARNIYPPPSDSERYQLGVSAARILGFAIKTAIIYQPEYINRLLENVAVNRGANLCALPSYQEGLTWLEVE